MVNLRKILGVFCLALLVCQSVPVMAETNQKGSGKQNLGDWLFGMEPIHFTLPTFHVPIIKGERIVSHVNIRITIETLGYTNRDKVISKRRRLYNAFLRDLHGVMGLRYRQGITFHAKGVKVRLMKIANKIHGKGIIKDILIDRIYQRQIN